MSQSPPGAGRGRPPLLPGSLVRVLAVVLEGLEAGLPLGPRQPRVPAGGARRVEVAQHELILGLAQLVPRRGVGGRVQEGHQGEDPQEGPVLAS